MRTFLLILLVLIAIAGSQARPGNVRILQNPRDQVVRVKGEVKLEVVATASGPIGYQWFFEGDSMEGATNATLELKNVRREQAGLYSVRVEGGSVVMSQSARVEVAWEVELTKVEKKIGHWGPNRMPLDAVGNLYEAGAFTRTNKQGVTNYGLAVTKKAPGGASLWTAEYGQAKWITLNKWTVTPTGKVYLMGGSGTENSPEEVELVIVSISEEGVVNWSTSFRTRENYGGMGVSPDGSVYISAVRLGGGEETGAAIKTNGWPSVKIGPTGKIEWYTKGPNLPANSMVVDRQGNLNFVGGEFNWFKRIYEEKIAKVNSEGEVIWSHDGVQRHDQDAGSRLILTVGPGGEVILAFGVNVSSDYPSVALEKVDAQGTRYMVHSGGWTLPVAEVDADGNLYVGVPEREIHYFKLSLPYVAKLDPDGYLLFETEGVDYEGWPGPMHLELDGRKIKFAVNVGNGDVNFWVFAEFIQNEPDLPYLRRVLPASGRYKAGDMHLSVLAGGSDLRYQWRLGGEAIPGATNSTLVLTNLQTSPVGGLSVLVRNERGIALSKEIELTMVPIKPFTVGNLRQIVTLHTEWDRVVSTNYHTEIDINGEPGRFYWIESSTNLVDWKIDRGRPTFEEPTKFKFYRAVTEP